MAVVWVDVRGPGWLQVDPKILDVDDPAGHVAVQVDPRSPAKRVGRFLARSEVPLPHERRHRKHDDVCPVLHPDPDLGPPPTPVPAAVQPALSDDLDSPGAQP